MVASGPLMYKVCERVRQSFPYFKPDMLAIKSREPRFVHPRQFAWYLLRVAGKSYPWIAKITGGWNHTTVIHGVEAHIRNMNNRDIKLNKQGIKVDNTTHLLQEIAELEATIAQYTRDIDNLTYEKRVAYYKLNDLREKIYESRNNQTADGGVVSAGS